MSLRLNYAVELSEIKDNRLTFKLKKSDLLINIYVLKDNLLRVYFSQGEQKKTWMIAPKDLDMPYEGLDADEIVWDKNVSFTTNDLDGDFEIVTDKIKLSINKNDFHLTWYYKIHDEWNMVLQDRYTQAYNFEGELGPKAKHYLTRFDDEKYYGLGEKTGLLERSNRRFKNIGIDPMGYDPMETDPLYKMVPFYITKKQNCNVGIFYDTISKSEFDMGKEYDNYHGQYRYYESIEKNLDYYVFVNDLILESIIQVTKMTGQPAFMPKWSISYSGSTMTYTDAPDAQVQMNKFVDKCIEHDVPCTSFQLSSGYTSIGEKRHVFNWNNSKFPDIKAFTSHYQNNGINLCANIKPALLLSNPKYEECKTQKLFISNQSGDPELVQFWDELGSYLDFTNKDTIVWWKKNVKKQLLDHGITSTWNDNNEFEIWSETALCNGFNNVSNFELNRAIQPLLMMKASFDIQVENVPNKRPYLISRSGCSGLQRYAQTWSGDNRTNWKSLKYNIKTGLGLSMCGIHNIGHDVGGFAGNKPSPELFIRWVQNGIFHPRLTIHSWNDDKTVNSPWMYPEHSNTIVKLLKFRETLKPYIYDLMYKSHSNYLPIITPTFVNFESDDCTLVENDDFMLGNEILVCSVVNKGDVSRQVYLPKNTTGWYEYKTSKFFEGGQTVEIEFGLEDINFFVQAGSILYLNDSSHGFNKSCEERTFKIFVASNEVIDYSFYEDDGISNIKSSNHAFIKCSTQMNDDKLIVTVSKTGDYETEFKDIIIDVIGHSNIELIVDYSLEAYDVKLKND